MITIKAAFSDCIQSILHHKKSTDIKNLPHYMLTKEVFKENDSDKIELINLFKECINYNIEDDTLIFTIYRSEDEKNKWIDDQKKSLKYKLLRLKKWFNSNDKDKKQIENYLIYRKLEWILKEIKNTNA